MIVIDSIIFYIQKTGGISVVWKEILSRLCFQENVLYLVYKKKSNNIFYDEIFSCFRNIFYLKLLSLKIQRYFSLKLDFIDRPFLFHSSYYRTCSNSKAINITTVHDFTYEYYYKGLKRNVHLWQKYRAISKSDYIICISKNTERDLLKFLPNIDNTKIRVIYNGVSDDYFWIKERETLKLPFALGTYILFVGSREKYKNFELAVKSVAHNKLKFVIVGAPLCPEELELLQVELGQSNFIQMGRVSNEELNCLYNGAMAFLYPSEYEGFGIPVLEAQKSGCPVIAYNASSIPEIIGDTPLLLEALSIESVTKCFDILKIEKDRDDIICKGIENAKRFTWNRMYEQVMALYKEAWDKSKK